MSSGLLLGCLHPQAFRCKSGAILRAYSTLTPVKIYENAYLEKKQILEDNKTKAGVYRWVNKLNGASYVGSSINLRRRILEYFDPKTLTRSDMVITRAILKHKHVNFCLEILEYCTAKECIEREQYYLDILQPEYNVLKIAGSSVGYSHPPTSKIWKHLKAHNSNLEEIERLRAYNSSPAAIERLKCLNSSPEHQEHLKRLHSNQDHIEHLRGLNVIKAHKVSVLDTATGETKFYPSIRGAAEGIGINPGTLLKAFHRKKEESSVLIQDKRYLVTKLNK